MSVRQADPELAALLARASQLHDEWHAAERAALLAAVKKADGFVKRAAALLGRPYSSIVRLLDGRHSDVGAIATQLRAAQVARGDWSGVGRPVGE